MKLKKLLKFLPYFLIFVVIVGLFIMVYLTEPGRLQDRRVLKILEKSDKMVIKKSGSEHEKEYTDQETIQFVVSCFRNAHSAGFVNLVHDFGDYTIDFYKDDTLTYSVEVWKTMHFGIMAKEYIIATKDIENFNQFLISSTKEVDEE